MVEKCKLSGNPRRKGAGGVRATLGGLGGEEGRGRAVASPRWVDNGVSPAYQPAKTP